MATVRVLSTRLGRSNSPFLRHSSRGLNALALLVSTPSRSWLWSSRRLIALVLLALVVAPGTLADFEYPQRAVLTSSDGLAGDYFAYPAVAVDGDTIVIGANKHGGLGVDAGAAYVYTRDFPGNLSSSWTERAILTGSATTAGERLGFSVAIDGDTLVLGAKGMNSNKGGAYVFTRDSPGNLASNWTQRAILEVSDGSGGSPGDQFGWSVAVDGDTIAVGEIFDDSSGGSAYVFRRDNAGDLSSTWSQVGAKLKPSDASSYPGSNFGVSVALDGDTLVVGSHVKASQTGGAYVFTRNNAGDLSSYWTERAILEASDGAVGDRFGNSVAIDGDTIVIGAHKDHNPDSDSGSAYIFTRNDPGSLTSAWTESKLKPDHGAADDLFGNGVSIEGDVVVIGAYGDDNSKGSNSGAVYVFWRDSTDPSGWTQVAKLIANDGAQNTMLGYGVSISGDTLVAGRSAVNGGSAYVFTKFVYCDASAAPANGVVGDCTSRLAAGTTCQPTCDEGYLVSGPSACDAEGVNTSAICRELTCCERTFVKFGFGVPYS